MEAFHLFIAMFVRILKFIAVIPICIVIGFACFFGMVFFMPLYSIWEDAWPWNEW